MRRKLAEKIKIDPKSFYAYVRSISQTKTMVGPLTNTAGELSADNEEMAKLLNDAFSSMFTQEDLSNLPAPRNHHKVVDGLMLSDIVMSEKLIRESIDKLQDNKAAGVDQLNSTFMKGAIGGIVKSLLPLFESR